MEESAAGIPEKIVKMKTLILLMATVFLLSSGLAQNEIIQTVRAVKTEDGNLTVIVQKDGKYFFSYQNGMTGKTDQRNIVFNSRQEIRNFERRISRALSAKDGTSDLITYKSYKIRLLTEIGGVFMIVNEKGQSQSTLRISKEMYNQVNML
ncbi:MAG TPA: hypothetical protein VGH64_00050 [Puia sp.]|jgi:hypothetical protein